MLNPFGAATPSATEIDPATVAFLNWLVQEEYNRQADYRQFREYYDGSHNVLITDRQRRYLQLKTGIDFRANYTPIVVDSMTERMQVTGFAAGDQSELLWQWWTHDHMDAVQGIVHLATIRDGDAYVMVGWDSEANMPTFSFEPAICDGEGAKVVYGEQRNHPTLASKRWRSEKQRRMNVYYPDRIEKFTSKTENSEGAWQKFIDPADPRWPLPWMVGNKPLGIPLIHFRNKDQGYNYGRSELSDVIPIQNAINKSMLDLLAAADTTAFRVFWMIGDDPSKLEVAPGTFIYSSHPPSGPDGTAVGYFPGEDLSHMISVCDHLTTEVARITRTPISYFQVSQQRPAEGTLKQEESGLIGKVVDRQVSIGDCWESAMMIARRLAVAYGEGYEALNLQQSISVTWRDPQTRNEVEHLQALESKQKLGIPRRQLWTEAGYNAAQIADMEKMLAQEKAATGDLGEMMLRAFERGGTHNPAEPDVNDVTDGGADVTEGGMSDLQRVVGRA